MKHKRIIISYIISICNFGKDNHELNKHIIDDIFVETHEDTKLIRSNMISWHSKMS